MQQNVSFICTHKHTLENISQKFACIAFLGRQTNNDASYIFEMHVVDKQDSSVFLFSVLSRTALLPGFGVLLLDNCHNIHWLWTVTTSRLCLLMFYLQVQMSTFVKLDIFFIHAQDKNTQCTCFSKNYHATAPNVSSSHHQKPVR